MTGLLLSRSSHIIYHFHLLLFLLFVVFALKLLMGVPVWSRCRSFSLVWRGSRIQRLLSVENVLSAVRLFAESLDAFLIKACIRLVVRVSQAPLPNSLFPAFGKPPYFSFNSRRPNTPGPKIKLLETRRVVTQPLMLA